MRRKIVRQSMKASWLAFAFVSLTTTQAFACEQVRAALDIGSGTTKMVVASVDTCENRVLEVLAPAPGEKLERQVDYIGNIDRRIFKEEIIAEGLTAILELKEVALTHGAESFSAVATEAFRRIDSAPRSLSGIRSLQLRINNLQTGDGS